MITLKMNPYTVHEVKMMEKILSNALDDVRAITPGCAYTIGTMKCQSCEHRHICVDLVQASMFASEYTPKR